MWWGLKALLSPHRAERRALFHQISGREDGEQLWGQTQMVVGPRQRHTATT